MDNFKEQIKIGHYEDWMEQQVVDLFCLEYGGAPEAFKNFFTSFYNHPVQKDKALKVVALDGDKVVGFQSYFHWPYLYNGNVKNTYQSGNSLVHPEYRGRRIFSNLLKFIESLTEDLKVDFFVGFPVEASFGSFLRKGWEAPFKVRYLVKVNSLFSPLSKVEHQKLEERFSSPFRELSYKNDGLFRLYHTKEFDDWKKGYRENVKFYTYEYESENGAMQVEMKFRIQAKYIRELVIGDIRRNTSDPEFLKEGLKALLQEVSKLKFVSMISVLTNFSTDNGLLDVLKGFSFRPIKKQFNFIVKSFSNVENVISPAHWEIYYTDFDTW